MTDPADPPRAIPPDFDAAVVAEIDARLATIESAHSVRIAFAIESGSRAWGFPSPDSDYDCRFVYIRGRADYLSLFPKRDVIETPLTEVLDVNGWDLAKAIRLLLKGNAVVIEWLTSPIVYRAIPGFRTAFLQLAHATAERPLIARHYLHLGWRQVATTLDDPEDVPLKKLFYALRPALALRWLRLHPDARVAPMHFPTLCAEADLDRDLDAAIRELLARKSGTRELGRGPAPLAIRAIIVDELKRAETELTGAARLDPAHRVRADVFFLQMLDAHAP